MILCINTTRLSQILLKDEMKGVKGGWWRMKGGFKLISMFTFFSSHFHRKIWEKLYNVQKQECRNFKGHFCWEMCVPRFDDCFQTSWFLIILDTGWRATVGVLLYLKFRSNSYWILVSAMSVSVSAISVSVLASRISAKILGYWPKACTQTSVG